MAGFPKAYKWMPRNPQKYIGNAGDIWVRSSWEKKFCLYCDNNPLVVAWTSEYPIEYFSQVDQKMHRYFVDFFVRMRDINGKEKTLMVEVKPNAQTKPPSKPRSANHHSVKRYISECETFQVNSDKWDAAREFAAKNNFQFVVLDEYDLGIARRP